MHLTIYVTLRFLAPGFCELLQKYRQLTTQPLTKYGELLKDIYHSSPMSWIVEAFTGVRYP